MTRPIKAKYSGSDPIGFQEFTVSDVVDVANGGTGSANRTDGFNALAPASPAKGDMLAFNGTNWVKVTVGTNGYMIYADSSATAGIKWDAAPTVSGGGMNPIVAAIIFG